MSLQIQPAYEKLNIVRELFIEYQTKTDIDLCFQSFEAELASLPGKYAEPYGRLYIASYDNSSAGCIAILPIDNEDCEIKRLFVRAQFRKLGIGRTLVEQVINDAKYIGYTRLLLETSPTMKEAIALYKKLGFINIEPYHDDTNGGIICFGLMLVDK